MEKFNKSPCPCSQSDMWNGCSKVSWRAGQKGNTSMVELIESETGWPAPAASSSHCRRYKQLLNIPARSSPRCCPLTVLLSLYLFGQGKDRTVQSKDVKCLASGPWPIDSSALIGFIRQDKERVDVPSFPHHSCPQEKPRLIVFPPSFVS